MFIARSPLEAVEERNPVLAVIMSHDLAHAPAMWIRDARIDFRTAKK